MTATHKGTRDTCTDPDCAEAAGQAINQGLADLFLRLGPPPGPTTHGDDPHASCFEPHLGADGYVDCDGRPI